MIILASASPRRREILGTLGIEVIVRPSSAEEIRAPGEEGRAFARRVARAKASEIAAGEPSAFVLGADTIVEIDGEVLGKPEHEAAARGMLRMLAGRWHEVTTAVSLLSPHGRELSRQVTTRVKMRPLTVEMVERYVATGEGRDKAGSYAVQGMASGFVTAIEGSYTNVVGLPAAETVELLEEAGALAGWPR